LMGLLTGTVLGAGIGMLFAPKAGSELRSQLTDQAGNLANQASEGSRRVTENAGEWVDRGRDMYDKAKDAVSGGAEEAQRYGRDSTTSVSSSPATAASGASGSSASGSGPILGSGSSHGSAGAEDTAAATRRRGPAFQPAEEVTLRPPAQVSTPDRDRLADRGEARHA
jgi:gas vesicle protein